MPQNGTKAILLSNLSSTHFNIGAWHQDATRWWQSTSFVLMKRLNARQHSSLAQDGSSERLSRWSYSAHFNSFSTLMALIQMHGLSPEHKKKNGQVPKSCESAGGTLNRSYRWVLKFWPLGETTIESQQRSFPTYQTTELLPCTGKQSPVDAQRRKHRDYIRLQDLFLCNANQQRIMSIKSLLRRTCAGVVCVCQFFVLPPAELRWTSTSSSVEPSLSATAHIASLPVAAMATRMVVYVWSLQYTFNRTST